MMLLGMGMTWLSGTDLPQLPRLESEFRGVWVATVANIDWPSKPGLPSSQQQAELLAIMDKARAMHLNAIVLQIRPSADALYDSKIEPWSAYLTGVQGVPPDPYYDPLAFAVQAAHERGLELHCWFNPYRALLPAARGSVASRHISRQNPRIVKSYGGYLWLDPGEPATRERSLSVILDVVHRYDIDGVHIDDYFYPYKVKDSRGQTVDFPDEPSWKRYEDGGGKLSRDDWRRENVDTFVESLYKEIKHEKPWVKFGISPFGIYRPGIPTGIIAGVDQYADLYADAQKWLNRGWCDYFSPQLYWSIDKPAQSYPKLLEYWLSQNTENRHVWPGNYTTRLESAEGDWPCSEIVNQVITTRKAKTDGNVHFSMKTFMHDEKGIDEALLKGPYANVALVPASPWLDPVAPKPPFLSVDRSGQVTATPDHDADIRFYVYEPFVDGKWQSPTVTSNDHFQPPVDARAIAVIALDRVGNQSTPTVTQLNSGS